MKTLSLLLLLLPMAASAFVKSAEDYFHAGAGKYVASRLQEASIEVEEGLRHYPDDARLKGLATQLKNMKDQQKKDQGQAGSQGSDQDKGKQDKKDQDKKGQGQNQPKQDDKQNQDKKNDQDKNGKGDQNQDQPQAGKEDQDKQGGDSSGQAMAPAKPGQMSKEEAERLLNSYQDDEKKEHSRMERKAHKVEVQEDW